MKVDFGLVYPLWSHADRAESLLERLVGEIGIDHVTIPVISGPVSTLRTEPDDGPHVFMTEGGWHYPPNRDRYAASVRPRAAKWVGSRNLLERVVELAGHYRLRVQFRIDLRGIPSLIDHERTLLMRNMWGEENPDCGLCAMNPVVQELLRETLADLADYKPSGVQLAGWKTDERAPGSWDRPLVDLARARMLADVCFCAACRETAAAAGVDPDFAARSAAVEFGKSIRRNASEQDSDDDIDLDDAIAGYLAARADACERWLTRLAKQSPIGGFTYAEFFYGDGGGAWPGLLEGWRYLGVVDSDGIPGVEDLIGLVGNLMEIPAAGIETPCWHPLIQESSELVRLVNCCEEMELSVVEFRGIDSAPSEVIQWIKQAVRYAKRG